MRTRFLSFALAVACLCLVPAAFAAADDCLVCHADRSLSMTKAGRSVPLFVDADSLKKSPHADLGCVDCHAGFDASNLPHRAKIEPVDCLGCHSDPAASHAFHAAMQEGGEDLKSAPASCKTCHGTHDVERARPAGAAGGARNPGVACSKCHSDVVTEYLASRHGESYAAGEKGAPDCMACHRHKITRASDPQDRATLKMEQEKLCLSCHLQDAEVIARMGPKAGFIAAYQGSVHGSALEKGNGAAANCVDCHGSHTVQHGSDPRSPLQHSRLQNVCAKCHGAVVKEYEASVHGAALAKGVAGAPVCTDCHGEHTIYKAQDPRSPVASKNVSAQVCTPCHASVALSVKYGLPKDRSSSFADSYHGLALRGGSVAAANCASCHGAHNILPSSDPLSTVAKQNLAVTCGKCHPRANERFAIGAVHVTGDSESEPILYWIATIYIGMILGTIGGMLAHNALDFVKKSKRHLLIRRGELEIESAGRGLYLRMTLAERIQHASLMISFILLVITGFMLRYPDAFWVSWVRGVWEGAFEARSLVHRIAGAVMIVASLFHICYLAFTARGRELVRDLFPVPQDARDVILNLRYYLGLTEQRPAFARFGYVEKAEYWALVWGTGVMAVTGLLMWFENSSIGVITKLGWDIARTIHFYEAWLATLAILVWHIYFVIFNPDAYPMNMAWITGHLTEIEMEEEHPLELERLRRQRLEEELRAAGMDGASDGPSEGRAAPPPMA